LFPDNCAACGKRLPGKEILCISCEYSLPKTNFHKQKDNKVAKSLWGRVDVEAATSLYYFSKGSRVQKLIHNLKYNGKQDVGIHIGKLLGLEIKDINPYNQIDVIVPVPLHPLKYKSRGFNQSDLIAEGISEILKVPYLPNAVQRISQTGTQTKKSRWFRWLNVGLAFRVNEPNMLNQKTILIVDDVVTTGATLEALIAKIKEACNCKIIVATIAYAERN